MKYQTNLKASEKLLLESDMRIMETKITRINLKRYTSSFLLSGIHHAVSRGSEMSILGFTVILIPY